MDSQPTTAVNQKFHADGTVRAFPGNTIICFCPPDSHTYEQVEWLQAEMKKLPFAHKFGFLPPSSFHMTVMELLCDQVRVAERWSAGLSLAAPLTEMDAFFMARVPQIEPPAALRMRFKGISQWSLALYLEPADEETAVSLRTYRQAVSEKTAVRFSDHDTYEYHISIAYRLYHLTDAEEAELESRLRPLSETLQAQFDLFQPPPPQLTFFDDMFAFYPVSQRHLLATR
ncbi:MAG: DUF1868 domain-containing protein [Chloroflexota bacterium]